MHKLYANRLDLLEIAFERNQLFENTIAYMGVAAPPPSDMELACMWEETINDVPGLDDEGPREAKEEPQTPLDDFVIGQWRFQRGAPPGSNSHYKFNFKVTRTDITCFEDTYDFGYVYFETYKRNRNHVYLRMSNILLYDEDALWRSIRKFQEDFHLSFVYVSKVDIAVDCVFDVSQYIFNRMERNKEIEWVINGKRIVDRDKDVLKTFFLVSGPLNNPAKYKSFYAKQKEGLTLNCYNKTMEIVDKSSKYYQIGDFEMGDDGLFEYVEEDRIYRNEIRLTRKVIADYTTRKSITDDQFFTLLQNDDDRDSIFDDMSRRMIRWNRFGQSYSILSLVKSGKYMNKEKCA